jgi:hypothetical protein
MTNLGENSHLHSDAKNDEIPNSKPEMQATNWIGVKNVLRYKVYSLFGHSLLWICANPADVSCSCIDY